MTIRTRRGKPLTRNYTTRAGLSSDELKEEGEKMQSVAILEQAEIEALKQLAGMTPLIEKAIGLLNSLNIPPRPLEWFMAEQVAEKLKVSKSYIIAHRNDPEFPFTWTKLSEQTVRYRLKEGIFDESL